MKITRLLRISACIILLSANKIFSESPASDLVPTNATEIESRISGLIDKIDDITTEINGYDKQSTICGYITSTTIVLGLLTALALLRKIIIVRSHRQVLMPYQNNYMAEG